MDQEEVITIRVGRRTDPGSIPIDRRTPLGNPFIMRDKTAAERNRVCDQYDLYFKKKLLSRSSAFMAMLEHLFELAVQSKEITVGCWCSPKRCHGDTIARYLQTRLEEAGYTVVLLCSPLPTKPDLKDK